LDCTPKPPERPGPHAKDYMSPVYKAYDKPPAYKTHHLEDSEENGRGIAARNPAAPNGTMPDRGHAFLHSKSEPSPEPSGLSSCLIVGATNGAV